MMAVANTATQIENATAGKKGLGQRVGSDVPLPGRIEALSRGHDPLAGDPLPALPESALRMPRELHGAEILPACPSSRRPGSRYH